MKIQGTVTNIVWAVAFTVVGVFFMKGCFQDIVTTEHDVNMQQVKLKQKQVELQILKERKCCDEQ